MSTGRKRSMIPHFRTFAAHNAWTNSHLDAATAKLTPTEFAADRGTFFHSVPGMFTALTGQAPDGDLLYYHRAVAAGTIWPDRLAVRNTAPPFGPSAASASTRP